MVAENGRKWAEWTKWTNMDEYGHTWTHMDRVGLIGVIPEWNDILAPESLFKSDGGWLAVKRGFHRHFWQKFCIVYQHRQYIQWKSHQEIPEHRQSQFC